MEGGGPNWFNFSRVYEQKRYCSNFERQHYIKPYNEIVTKKQTQRQTLKTSFKIFRGERKSRYINVEENTGIMFNNFNNLNGRSTDNKNKCPGTGPYFIPV